MQNEKPEHKHSKTYAQRILDVTDWISDRIL